MPCKKVINNPECCVDEMLKGMTAAYPGLTLIPEQRIIFHSKNVDGKVALISGGGSGHEPFAAGYVGQGMLNAAVAGSVFASPPSASILQAIKAVSYLNQNSGILLIVPNYTGDRLNFGLAAEEACFLNIRVGVIHVGEDCALPYGNETGAESRRGLCGHLFVFKIAGAMASENQSLTNIQNTCISICQSMATFGVCLKPCSLPGQDVLFNLADDEVELGLGIHGEAGVSKSKLTSASDLVRTMLEKLCTCLPLSEKSEVCVLINNLGGTSQLEMGIVANEVKTQLNERKITVHRLYVGSFMTSMEMSGFQICLLNVSSNQHWLRYIDLPAEAPAWPGSTLSIPCSEKPVWFLASDNFAGTSEDPLKFEEKAVSIFERCLRNISAKLTSHTKVLNDLDSVCGDGDTGSTLQRFASGIDDGLQNGSLCLSKPVVCLHQLAKIASEKMGGTSGAVYGLFFRGMASSLDEISPSHWATASNAGISCIMKYSSAKLGDRTLLDSLIPAQKAFEESLKKKSSIQDIFQNMLIEAKAGCKRTSQMKARVGRASYVNEAYTSNEDAGAFAVTVILEGITDTFSNITP